MAKQNDRFIFQNIGPIKSADIELADFTVFVGQQASGKTIALEFLTRLQKGALKSAGNIKNPQMRLGLK